MAIRVSYFEDQKPEHYVEGPFIMVNANGWRIEMENPGARCSCIPYGDFHDLLSKEMGRYYKSDDEGLIAFHVDRLNKKVLMLRDLARGICS